MRKVLSSLVFGLFLLSPAALAQNANISDTTPPTFSGVTVSGLTSTSATVTWTTNEAATSYVDFGPNDSYGNSLGNGSYVIPHSVNVLGLTPNTLYHFRVRSKDMAGYEAVSTDMTLTSASTTVNANANANKNTNLNSNKNVNSNANTNTATNKNANANKNTNLNGNRNSNSNANTNKNTNVNSSADSLFNQNLNSTSPDTTNTALTNADVTNLNATTSATTGDGRTGLILIGVGVLLLIGIVIIAWRKARRSPNLRV